MAVLKKIKFGTGEATPIAQTVVTAASGSVLSVAGTSTGLDDDANPSYAVDLNISGDGTLVKDTTGEQAVLKVGTVPAAQVSVAAGGHTTDGDSKTFVGDDVEEVLTELNTKISQTGGAAKSYKIVEVANPASSSLKEYKVQVAVGDNAFADDTNSATIVVPKDQHLKDVEIVGQDGEGKHGTFVKYTYTLVDGTDGYIYLDVSSFLQETEFANGLTVSGGVVSANLGNGLEFGNEANHKSINVKIDSTSEKDSQATAVDFLTVGSDGVKVQGIKDEINRKIAALDVTDTAVAGEYVNAVSETDGKVSVSRVAVSAAPLNNYTKGSDATAVAASDTINQAISKLENQVDAAKAATTSAIQDLDHTDTAVDGQVVTAVSTADGIATPTKVDFAGITLGGFTQDATATGDIAAADTLGAALNKLENGIDAAKQAATAGHSAVAKDANANHFTLTESTNATTGQKTYTIGESDIASDSDLDAEVTRAKAAESEIAGKVGLAGAEGSRTFTPTTNYGSGSVSVVDNMQKIDTTLKAVSDKANSIQYKVNGTTLEFYGMTAHA